jgi:hypothetical protein
MALCVAGCGSVPAETQSVPVREICTGEDRFTFQRANSNKQDGTVFGILWRNGMAYLRVDGHCRFFAYKAYRNEPIVTGTLSTEEAADLARETEYDRWPELDGLEATGTVYDVPVEVLNDGAHELLCTMGCRDHPRASVDGQVEKAATLRPMFDRADGWRDRLLERGTAMDGNVRFAVAIREKAIHSGSFVEWPLATPVEQYAIDPSITQESEDYVPVGTGYLAKGSDALALRKLRQEADEHAVEGAVTEGWIAVDGPGEIFYEVVVADVLPYEDATGVVPRKFID